MNERHQPTALPWSSASFQVSGADKSRVAHTGMGQHRTPEALANAELIVRAVNAHDHLVAAIAALLTDYRTEGCPDRECLVCRKSKAAKQLADEALKLAREGLVEETNVDPSWGGR